MVFARALIVMDMDELLKAVDELIAGMNELQYPLEFPDYAVVPPASEKSFAIIEKRWGYGTVPADLRTFWTLGFRNIRLEGDERGDFAGTRFVGPESLLSPEDRAAVDALKPEDVEVDRRGTYRGGLPFWNADGTRLVLRSDMDKLPGSVYYMHSEGGADGPVTDSFGEFLLHLAACGFYAFGPAEKAALDKHLEYCAPALEKVSLLQIPPHENRWLNFINSLYSGNLF